MRYGKVIPGTFVERPNRFIAYVEIEDGPRRVVKCHVKNTGRCKELLVPGVRVHLAVSDNPTRSTMYDLIVVEKGDLLVNIDSQVPNQVVAESLTSLPFFKGVTHIRREFKYGNSRIDIMATDGDRRYLIEVKGVTLEHDRVARFPDAPSERGAKHLRELISSLDDGYVPYVFFVIQMEGMRSFEPNWDTDPMFSETLALAKESGVTVIAYGCHVTADSIDLTCPVDICIDRHR